MKLSHFNDIQCNNNCNTFVNEQVMVLKYIKNENKPLSIGIGIHLIVKKTM